MTAIASVKVPVLVPFVCPVSAAAQAVQLLALARAGPHTCTACNKRLRAMDVSRAMHNPRR
jgi:hypothetical protein